MEEEKRSHLFPPLFSLQFPNYRSIVSQVLWRVSRSLPSTLRSRQETAQTKHTTEKMSESMPDPNNCETTWGVGRVLEINKRKEKHLHISTTIGSIIRFSAKAYQNGLSPLEKEMTCRNRKGWASTNRMKPVTGLSVSRENESAISLLVNKPWHPVNESEFVIIHSSRELLRGIRRPPKQQQTNKPTNQHVPCLSTRLCFHFINVPEKEKKSLPSCRLKVSNWWNISPHAI